MKLSNILSSLVPGREQQPLNTVDTIQHETELNETDLRSVNGGHHRHHRHHHHHHGHGWGWGWGYGDCDYDDCDY